MRKFYYPIKDVSLYEEYPTRQTGMDEILEVGKTTEGDYSIRSLLEFDIASISASISAGTIDGSANFDLKVFSALQDRIIVGQVLALYPVSQSWVEGQGYFYQDRLEETSGATWSQRDTGSLWANSGSSYLSGSEVSGSEDDANDFTFDVTDIIRSWVSGSISNYGAVLKFSDFDESNLSNTGCYKFYSRQTHTVYSPMLVAKWDDSTYNTGSMDAAPDTGLIVYPANLRPAYRTDENVRIDLVARAQYPLKTFDTQFTAWQTHYLPATSYFSIIDAQSKEVIIPFDDYSKVSEDSSGPFVNFTIQNMHPRRFYLFLIKVVTSTGYEYVFDNNYTFTITL